MGEGSNIRTFWDKFTKQAVGIFVCSALPWSIRRREIERHARDCVHDIPVGGKFMPPVRCNAFHQGFRHPAEHVLHGVSGQAGVAGGHLFQQTDAGFSVYKSDNKGPALFTSNRVSLIMSALCPRLFAEWNREC